MDLPAPITKKPFCKTNELIHAKLTQLTQEKLDEAVSNLKEVINKNYPENVTTLEDGSVAYKVAVTLDGTWQKRGHSSKYGVVFLISVLTGEVLDYVVKSLFCHQCSLRESQQGTEIFDKWWEGHKNSCSINHEGSSGSMETTGAIEMFLRSIDKYKLIYSTFVGDGDSSSFGSVKEKCNEKYGDIYNLTKEECVGHVQKRLGTALRNYKLKHKGQTLSDGRSVGGSGRLTDVIIDKMQNNFGYAIRNNIGNKERMYNAIWAIYHHTIRNDKEPLAAQHRFGPTNEETWCKYWKSQKNQDLIYSQKKRLPEVFLTELKPLFERLSSDQLLNRCLQGLTQNQNEALNGVLWSICPKIRFCGRTKLESAVCETINRFNAGSIPAFELLKSFGISPGQNMLHQLQKENESRIAKANRKVTGKERAQRQKLRSKKKRKSDKIQKLDGKSYIPGGFGLTSKPDLNTEVNKEQLAKKSKNQPVKHTATVNKSKTPIDFNKRDKLPVSGISLTFVDEKNILLI